MLVIDKTHNGGSANVTAGEPFRVELPENPTTGFTWHLQDTPTTRLLSDTSATSGTEFGRGGMRQWTLEATQAGSATLTMELRRGGQVQPSDTFQVTVNARAR